MMMTIPSTLNYCIPLYVVVAASYAVVALFFYSCLVSFAQFRVMR